MSHRQRCCLTLEPLTAPCAPVHKVSLEIPLAPRPPHAVWFFPEKNGEAAAKLSVGSGAQNVRIPTSRVSPMIESVLVIK